MRAIRAAVRPEWVVLAVLMIVAAAFILHLGRGLTFFRDEWTFVLYRDGHDLENFLASHAGHLSVWMTGFYVFFFKATGLDSYEAIRIAALPAHLLVAGLLYVLARRRLGDLMALAPAAIVLFLGSGWMDILWPFQIGFTGSIACGLGALLLLERGDRAGDAGACILLLIAIGWSGTALPFLAGVAAGLLVRGRLWRRIWVVAIPGLAYLAWTLEYWQQGIDYADNLPDVPGYFLDIAGAGVAGITGLPQETGVVIAVAVLLVAAARAAVLGRESPLAWEALAICVSFWGLTALARAQDNDPAAVRYVYPSAVFLLLLVSGVAPRGRPHPALAVAVLVLAALCLPSNISKMHDGERDLRNTTEVAASELGVIEIARDSVDPAFTPFLRAFPIPAGAYLAAVDRYASSPAYSPAEIAATTNHARHRADITLVRATGLELRPARLRADGCRALRLPADLHVGERGIGLRNTTGGEVPVRIRRFAATFSVGLGSIPRGGAAVLRPPSDSAPEYPWRIRAGGAGKAVVCEPAA